MEFENIFYKNNYNDTIDKQYLDEYIELFINFKLKEKMLSNYNCENFSIISDNELFVYLKVDCQ